MNYANIKTCDIANGVGVRTSLFVSGCTHHCPGCFNAPAQDFRYGKPFTRETEDFLLAELGKTYVAGLTLLGGEPFEPENQRALLPFVRRVRTECPGKTVWAFSGYTWEELTGESRAHCEVTDALVSLVDVLVDGEFVEAQKDISLRFRGSANQRLIDVPASLRERAIIPWNG
ncbi:anaerobic ribonucleoside-triphosphate reductase activating protein [Oscillibacter valericigenes Sjm18-20]|nr:anaerobic ribonucleoside-triphosphate reductase activating protein [Oscillibacter valericigenes Sjm18-20]